MRLESTPALEESQKDKIRNELQKIEGKLKDDPKVACSELLPFLNIYQCQIIFGHLMPMIKDKISGEVHRAVAGDISKDQIYVGIFTTFGSLGMLTMDATGLDKPTPQLIQAITNNLDVLRMRSWLLFTDQAPAFVLPSYPGV